ncbi:MAG: hypothetical protein HYS21_13735 [Deltaproteobacteria bacterium]|nr:hypothetical protein [Deltaproteobacteria bacterium]
MLCKAISAGGSSISIEEHDGSPTIGSVVKLIFNNGAVTDMGGGIVRILLPTDIDGGSFQDTYVATNDIDGGVF